MGGQSAYANWIGTLSRRYRQSQIKASVAVNVEMLRFYFSLGADIVCWEVGQPWGSKFLPTLSRDLKAEMPEASCFSLTNLDYCRRFFKLYEDSTIAPQLEGQLVSADERHGDGDSCLLEFERKYPNVSKLLFSVPWGHHKYIMDKFRAERDVALFYVRETAANGWSRAVLLNFMDSGLHLRQGRAITNFELKLPEAESDLARQTMKDPYAFDFIALTNDYHERELKEALLANIQRFLLELGNGFAFVGREHRFQIGGEEKFADLVFYHYRLNRFVVVEVKTEKFEASHLGQLGLYVSAANHLLKRPTDAPTIGLLICKSKDDVVAKWALESASEPLGIAEYQLTKLLPHDLNSDLPTIAEIEAEAAKSHR